MLEYGWLGGMTFTNIYIWNIYIPVEVSDMDQLKFVEKLNYANSIQKRQFVTADKFNLQCNAGPNIMLQIFRVTGDW